MDKNEWNKVEDGLPDEGVLCIVYFPYEVHNVTGKTVGPIAIAYYRKYDGWIYADTPIPLRFKPYYWMPWDKR